MNAKEKLAIAQARDDETTSHDSGALMDYTSPPEIMGAPSPAYSGVAGPFLASGQIFAVPTPQGVNYYQALPPGFPAPQFVPQQVPAEAYQDESLLNMLQQLQQQPRSPQGSR